MILDALDFQTERAKVCGTCGDRAAGERLERLAIGPGERYGRVAGYPRCETMAFHRLQVGEAPFRALVHVAEPLFEAQDFFAYDRESEVSRFDDPRMHRA